MAQLKKATSLSPLNGHIHDRWKTYSIVTSGSNRKRATKVELNND